LDDEIFPHWVSVYETSTIRALEMNGWCEEFSDEYLLTYQNIFSEGEHMRYEFKRKIDAIRFVLENIVTNHTVI
jgi:hypothetical protein